MSQNQEDSFKGAGTSRQSGTSPRSSDAAWDPFADDLVITPVAPAPNPSPTISESPTVETPPPAVSPPVAISTEVHAVRNLAREREIAEQLAAEVVTKPTIIPETASELPPLARPEPFLPTRSPTLPDEKTVRPPQKLDATPDDDLYAIIEEPEVPPAANETSAKSTVSSAESDVVTGKPLPPKVPQPTSDPWKEIFDDELPVAWRKSVPTVASVSPTTSPADNVLSTSETSPSVPESPSVPGIRLRESAAQRQVERLEREATEKLQQQQTFIEDTELSTWEFFRQPTVWRRILILSAWGMALRGLFQVTYGEGAIGQITTMLVTFMCGGFCLVFFASYLMQTLRHTFEFALNRVGKLDEWSFEPFMEGVFSMIFPILAFFGSFLFIVPVLSMVTVTAFLLQWLFVPIHPILATNICALILFFLGYPLCYMTSLANNDAMDLIPIAVWKTRRVAWRRVGRFYLEQLGIQIFFSAFCGLLYWCGELSGTLFSVLSILLSPAVAITMLMLYHERLGRLCSDLALAERELTKKKKKRKSESTPS